MAQPLLDPIESDALNDRVPLATALRKCIALGGQSGSEKLRDWASRELNGYLYEELPEYRKLPAPLKIDAITAGAHVTRAANRSARASGSGEQIMALYCSVAPAAIGGVLDRIRTSLTVLVAEIRAVTPGNPQTPPTAAADQAVQVVLPASARRRT